MELHLSVEKCGQMRSPLKQPLLKTHPHTQASAGELMNGLTVGFASSNWSDCWEAEAATFESGLVELRKY